MQPISKRYSGFTLLEMIVALGIFSIVAVVAVSSLVKITGLNRQAQSMQNSMTNLGFALESISRELRLSSRVACYDDLTSIDLDDLSGTCPNGIGSIIAYASNVAATKFIKDESHPDGGYDVTCNLIYSYMKVTENGLLKLKKARQQTCGDSIPLTANKYVSVIDDTNLTLTGIEMKVSDADGLSVDANHSFIQIRLKGYTGVKVNERRDFDIQTAVSVRMPN